MSPAPIPDDPRPVVLEIDCGRATLVREGGRESEVLVLHESLSDALAARGPDHSTRFLAALFAVVDGSGELLAAGRSRRQHTLH